MPTNTKRLLAALAIVPTLSIAQVEMNWIDSKQWQQFGPEATWYQGGSTNVFLDDGTWTIAGCFGQPSLQIIFPNLTCPLGTTGFIAQGDVDGDGTNDQGSFWSVASLQRATVVEPFREELTKILSAPPSGIADILRTSGGDIAQVFDLRDASVIIWYNVLQGIVDDFEMTKTQMRRGYGEGPAELQRHYGDVPWGTYNFTFPALGNPNAPVPFSLRHLVAPDVYPGRGQVPKGWRLLNTEWGPNPQRPFFPALNFDPRDFMEFRWFGIDFTNTIPSDQMFLSFRGTQWVDLAGNRHISLVAPPVAQIAPNPPFPSPFNVPDLGANLVRPDTIVFPPYPIETPDGDRTRFLLGTFDGFYELGPFFFRPGDSMTGRLDWVRRIPGGGRTMDNVQRRLHFDLNMLDTYAGFAVLGGLTAGGAFEGFPFGTPTSQRAPLADFDGDGWSNLLEWALGSDVTNQAFNDANGQANNPYLPRTVPPLTPTFRIDGLANVAGGCSVTITKRLNVGNSLIYAIEHSPDGVNWNTLTNDGIWQVVETAGTLTATNFGGAVPACFFRVRVTLNPGGSSIGGGA